jgi:hypothetical protein
MSEELRHLIKSGNNDAVKKMISEIGYAYHKSLINSHGEHMLFWCIIDKNLELLEYLLKNQLIHPNLANYRHTCAITYACIENNIEAVKILLKYDSNPCRRSGFSNNLPKEDAESSEIIKIINEYENKYIPLHYHSYSDNSFTSKGPIKKDNFNHYQSCKYRAYMYYNAILCYLHIPDNLPHLKGDIKMDKLSNEIYEKEGIQGISKLCDKILKEYIDTIDKKDKNQRYCLNCDATENLLKCSKCKGAYFCNRNCQKEVNKFHKYDCTKK